VRPEPPGPITHFVRPEWNDALSWSIST
jgi:hypothetical protein